MHPDNEFVLAIAAGLHGSLRSSTDKLIEQGFEYQYRYNLLREAIRDHADSQDSRTVALKLHRIMSEVHAIPADLLKVIDNE